MTERPTRRAERRRIWRCTIAASCMALVACGVPTTGSPEAVPEGEVPEALRDSAETTVPSSPSETPQEQVTIWFARDDQLVAAVHRIPDQPTIVSVVAELLQGPTDNDRERGLRTAIADPEAIGEVTTARGTAFVELTSSFAELPASDQVVAIAQVVLTATDLRGIGRVRFLLGGEDVAVPLPDGTTSTDAVSRDDYLALTASG